jgi:hypothetical protein
MTGQAPLNLEAAAAASMLTAAVVAPRPQQAPARRGNLVGERLDELVGLTSAGMQRSASSTDRRYS